MRVVYKKTLVERFDELIVEAKRTGKEVDIVYLTYSEYLEARALMQRTKLRFDGGLPPPLVVRPEPQYIGTLLGLTIWLDDSQRA